MKSETGSRSRWRPQLRGRNVVHCVPKNHHIFIFGITPVKNEPILIIFGTLNPEGTWHYKVVSLPTSPTYCSYCTWRMSKKSFFSSGLLRHGLDCSRASWMRPLTNGGNDWERVSMHRVVTLNTLCSIASIYFVTRHNRFFSEPLTFFEENDVHLNLWTTLFFAMCIG